MASTSSEEPRMDDVCTLESLDCTAAKFVLSAPAFVHSDIDTIQRSGAVSRIHVVDPQEPEECVVLTRMSVSTHT